MDRKTLEELYTHQNNVSPFVFTFYNEDTNEVVRNEYVIKRNEQVVDVAKIEKQIEQLEASATTLRAEKVIIEEEAAKIVIPVIEETVTADEEVVPAVEPTDIPEVPALVG